MITLETYLDRLGLTKEQLFSRFRKPEFATARQVWWRYLLKKGYRNSDIVKLFNRNNSTISLGIKKVDDLISVKDKYVDRFLKATEE